MGFLVEPDTLSMLIDRRVFVAERGGQVIGFLVASPVPLRGSAEPHEALVEAD